MIRRLEVEADEISSFVQTKAHKQWIWIAMDATTRQVIVFHVGDRSHTSAKRLWAKMSEAYRQHATCYPDQYVVYERVIPTAQHRAISKLARKTHHVERFNNTLRQRVSRLVREAVVVFQEARQSYRGYQVVHLPLQPDKSSSITWIALPENCTNRARSPFGLGCGVHTFNVYPL